MSAFALVACSDGRIISLGARQARFLVEGSYAQFLGRTPHGTDVFHVPALSTGQVNEIVMAQVSLRDCDFCAREGATYQMACEPVELRVGPNRGGVIGGPVRPVMVCAQCKPRVEAGDREAMIEYLCESFITRGREVGLIDDRITDAVARRSIEPQLTDTVSAIFANMSGPPQEDK